MRTSIYELYLTALAYHPLSPLILSRGVDILPHQLAALYGDHEGDHKCPSPIPHRIGGLLRVGFPVNALIADETGLGKTVVSGLFILSLLLRGLARNIAIVVPKAIVGQWQDELLYKFGIYFRTIECGDEFLDLIDDLKYNRELRFIASVDLIKGKYGYEFVSSLPQKGLDLVVIDEAHHVITREETLRFKIAKELAKRSKSLVLMSATPFRGYYDIEYKRILELLGPGFLYIRRFKDQTKGADGRPLFPKRVSYTVHIKLDLYWYQAYLKLKELIETSSLPQLTKLILLKRLSSSLYALYVTLGRLRPPRVEDPFSEETDDVSGVEPDVRDSLYGRVRGLSHALQVALDITRIHLSQKELTLKELEFLRLLRALTKRYKVVVFTEYRATLDRLREVLSRAGIRFTYIHGGLSLKDRRYAITNFRNDAKVRVFLATDAAGEGINLQVAPYQVNYDLPWSPLKLEQRFGRIHRYGQKYTTYVYNLAVKGTIDDYILNKVMRKLDNVVKLLGDWVFDYIGVAIRPEEVRKLILKGLDVVNEKLIIERFRALRKEVHNPKCDNDHVYKQVKELKGYVSRYLHKIRGGRISTLELLRVSKMTIQGLNSNIGGDLSDIIVAVYKVHGHIVSLLFLERGKEGFLDPINNMYIDYNEVKPYLVRRVKEVAQFYGFRSGHEEVYGM